MGENRKIILVERPRYRIPTHNCFKLERGPIPEPGEDEFLVRTLWLGLDVYLHARMKRVSRQAEPVSIGDVMVGGTVGRVEQSNHPAYKPGELVAGVWGWQDYAISSGSRILKLTTELEHEHPSYALGALSRLTGLAAYVSITEVSKPRPGETVVIGAATGGLGQIAGQMVKLRGARAVGIAGSQKKCDFAVDELGYDACVCYNDDDFADQLRNACPEGVDVYLQTIGGDDLDAIMPLLNLYARIPVLGLMSLWSATDLPKGPDRTALFLNQAMTKRLRVEGVVGNDYFQSHFGEFHREMATWIRNGDIKIAEHIVPDLEEAPKALKSMFQSPGEHLGKLVVHIGD